MPINTIIYPVTDLEAAKAVFTAALGSGPTTDQPYYVGFEVDGQQVGLDPKARATVSTGRSPSCTSPTSRPPGRRCWTPARRSVQDPREVGGAGWRPPSTTPTATSIGLLHGAPERNPPVHGEFTRRNIRVSFVGHSATPPVITSDP